MFITEETNCCERLAGSGLKVTKQRAAILEILAKSDAPLTAEQVFLALKNASVPANLSTVYRVLEVLSDKKLVEKLRISEDTKTLFEYNRMIHKHNLICLGCNRVVAIRHCPLGDYEEKLAKETDFYISGHKLDIYGYCPECRKKYIKEDGHM